MAKRWSDEGALADAKELDAPLVDPSTELELEATRRGIRPPAKTTLSRYGITREDWLALLSAQGWRCPVCHKTGPDVKWNTDHEHVAGWARKPAAERARYVRGVLCVFCNLRRVKSRMGSAEAARIARYLKSYEQRRDR